MFHYQMQDGEYCLIDDRTGDTLNRSKEIAIGYSSTDNQFFVLHKHGSPDQVFKWFDEIREAYKKAGLLSDMNDIHMITGQIPIEELNKCLDISGYVGRMLKQLQLH